jgi:hypothetical protein
VFSLPSYTYHDVGDVIFEQMLLDRPSVCVWLESTLKSLPGVDGAAHGLTAVPAPVVTRQQLVKFHKAVTTSELPKNVSDSIRDFSRLWR